MPNCLIKNSIVSVPDAIDYFLEVESEGLAIYNGNNLAKELDRLQPYTQILSGLFSYIDPTNNRFWIVNIGSGKIVDAYSDPLNPTIYLRESLGGQLFVKPDILNGTLTNCYAYFFWDGNNFAMGYQASAPVSDDLVDKLFVAEIISIDGKTISQVNPISLPDEPYTKQLLDRGAVNVDNVYLSGIANTMRLSFPGGRFKFPGRNAYSNPKLPHTLTMSAIAQISYSLCDPEGNVLATETDFNFNRYWNGSQIVPLDSPNFATKQFIYLLFDGTLAVVLGTSFFVIEQAYSEFNTWQALQMPAKFKNKACFLSAIASVGNATNIADPVQVVASNIFQPAFEQPIID